jgi:hypothetical protein
MWVRLDRDERVDRSSNVRFAASSDQEFTALRLVVKGQKRTSDLVPLGTPSRLTG